MSDEVDLDPAERETLPPPPPDESRELRRTRYQLGAASQVYDEITAVVLAAASPESRAGVDTAIRDGKSKGVAIAMMLIGRAWDDGAACETDLRMAIAVLLNEVMSLQTQLGTLSSEVASLRRAQDDRDKEG